MLQSLHRSPTPCPGLLPSPLTGLESRHPPQGSLGTQTSLPGLVSQDPTRDGRGPVWSEEAASETGLGGRPWGLITSSEWNTAPNHSSFPHLILAVATLGVGGGSCFLPQLKLWMEIKAESDLAKVTHQGSGGTKTRATNSRSGTFTYFTAVSPEGNNFLLYIILYFKPIGRAQ